jgi:hypothetical protein
LAKTLLELRPSAGDLVKLEELAGPFARNLCDHLRIADKQGTFKRSRFLDACRRANRGKLSQQQLIDETVQLGFGNVIDAFHIVGRDETRKRFFIDERNTAGGIRITEEFSELIANQQVANLPHETEARWRLVETAWELGVSRALLMVGHDPATEGLFVVDQSLRRRAITGARNALSGYQKGHCF